MRTWISTLEEHQRRINEMNAATFSMVRQAKLAGASWADIGGALGISRQAAWEMYAGVAVPVERSTELPGQTSIDHA